MRVPAHSFALLLAAGFAVAGAAACGGGSDFAEAGSKKKSADADNSEDENQPTDEPQMVAGAFLNCAYVGAPNAAKGGGTLIGCGVYQDNHKVNVDGCSYDLKLYSDADQEVPMPTLPAQTESPWHVLANLPADYASAGYLKMAQKECGSPATFKLATKKISSSNALGTSAAGEEKESAAANIEYVPTSAGTTNPPAAVATAATGTLKSFPINGQWDGGDAGFISNSVAPDDFCDADGTVRSKLTDGSAAAINMFGNMVPTTIKVGSATVTDQMGLCYKPLSLIGMTGGSAYAKEARNCFFLRARGTLLIISKKAGLSAEVTLDALRKTAEAQRCQ